MDNGKKIMSLHLVAGVVAGYLSYIISDNIYALVVMLAVMTSMKYATNVLTKEKQKAGWWLGNGGLVYIFIWFISWVLFLNLL